MLHTEIESTAMKSEIEVSTGATASTSPDTSIKLDDQLLDRLGYKAELERRFGFWSMLGLSCTIMVTWEGWFATAGVGLINGGLAGCVWGFVVVWVGYTAVVASLAELISMVPTAGGQYHWTHELAPPQWRKFGSWITGWQIVCGWQADTAAVFYLIAIMIQALVTLNWPEYEAQRWHGTLIMWALIVVAVVFNTVMVKILPILENAVLVVHCASFLVVLVPLVYFGPHASPSDVFTQFITLSGYSVNTSFFVGLVTAVFAFIGADGAVHMCEEVQHARTAVPNALMASVLINGALGFGMVVAVMFTIGDVADALVSETGLFYLDYFDRALNSAAFATALTSILLVLFISAIVAILASTSRVTWAFARDNGLPGSSWIKKVSPSCRLPLSSILLTALISLLLSLINIGSAVAFNALVSLVVSAFYGSYAIPIALLAYRRAMHQPLEYGPWKLGIFGLPINILALVYLAITWTFCFFPIAIPVTPDTMNWSVLLWGGLMMFGTLWYFVRQRHIFTGPVVVVGQMDVGKH